MPFSPIFRLYHNYHCNLKNKFCQTFFHIIYKFIHKNPIWNIASILTQNVLSMPVKYLYAKIKFDIKFVGREKLKKAKKRGYFIYANHTQIFADTFIPSLANYPKRNFFIVDPANIVDYLWSSARF